MTTDEIKKHKIRILVRQLYRDQKDRIRLGNSLQLKKDGSLQKANNADPEEYIHDIPELVDRYQDLVDKEAIMLKAIKRELKGLPVYEQFLKGVKGCGPTMAAVIIAEYDIAKANTISALWQYTGLNPGMVRGKKKVDGETVETDSLIRGDRFTKGYLAPYNSDLRSKMIGVLGGAFLKAKSEYAKYYYDYKNRLQNSERRIEGQDKDELWSETSDLRRHKAAMRYMVKMFLKDLYVAWRTIEGLEVRPPYAEEYLGKKHHTA